VDLDIDLIKDVINQSMRYGINHIGFTGGEFILHPDFREIIDLVHGIQIPYSIVSNGFKFENEISFLYPRRDHIAYIAFSLDGHNAEVHDSVRGAGSFEKVTSSIKKCYEMGFHTRTCAAIGTHNIDYIEDIAMEALKCGVHEIVYTTVLPTPTNEKLVLSVTELKKAHLRILALERQLKIPVIVGTDIIGFGGLSHCCTLSMDAITVDAWGNLVFCCEMADYSSLSDSRDEVVCSLYDTTLDDAMIKYSEQVHQFRCAKLKDLGFFNEPYYYSNCSYCVDYFNKKYKVDGE